MPLSAAYTFECYIKFSRIKIPCDAAFIKVLWSLVLLDRIALITYVDAICCYRPSSVVCRSVTLVSLAKTAEPIDILFGLRTQVGQGNHVLDWGPDPPWQGAFLKGEGAAHCEV